MSGHTQARVRHLALRVAAKCARRHLATCTSTGYCMDRGRKFLRTSCLQLAVCVCVCASVRTYARAVCVYVGVCVCVCVYKNLTYVVSFYACKSVQLCNVCVLGCGCVRVCSVCVCV